MTASKNVLGIRDVDPPNDDELSDEELRSSILAKPRLPGLGAGQKRPAPSEEEKVLREKKKARRLIVEAEKRKRLVVGVDFGCTNSALAYVLSTNTPRDVEVITRWDGSSNDILEKCPSSVAYGVENSDPEDFYGFSVDAGMISKFDDEVLRQAMNSSMFHLPPGKTAIDVTADFLRYLYDLTLRNLMDMVGPEAVNQTPIFWVLTIPATWSHVARQATLQAAEEAGIGDRAKDEIALIDEPEAAAIACMRGTIDSFGDKQPFEPGKTVLIVDMGGGTVDLSSYTIRKIDPLQLEEACVGEGGTTCDRNLIFFLQNTFGPAFTQLPITKRGVGSKMMKAFEDIKRNFCGQRRPEKIHDLPCAMEKLDLDDENVRKKYDPVERVVKLSCDDIEAMFEPILTKTKQLVQRQIQRVKNARMPAITTVILAGGLGGSPYVQDKFRDFVNSEIDSDITVVSPKRAWSAIARGAAMRGLYGKPPVLFRRARDAIGICVSKRFDEEVHDEKDAGFCPLLGKRAVNQMHWLVKRGHKITPGMKQCIKCYLLIEQKDFHGPVKRYQDLWACTSNLPPERLEKPGKHTLKGGMVHANDFAVYKIGRIAMDITDMVNAEVKRFKKANGGAVPAQIDCDIRIELTVGSSKGILQVTAKAGTRKIVGESEIEYVADPAWKGRFIEE